MPALTDARSAVSFLTVVPVGRADGRAARPDLAAVWFPLVGALLGGLAGGLRALLLGALGGTAASILGIAVLIVATGALHHDGLADAADALGARGGRERRLEVMRDPRVGVFGALALAIWLLTMVAALAPLTGVDGVRSLVAAAAVGRWLALAHARALAPARSDGLGVAFHPGMLALALSGALVLVGIPLLCGALPGGVALAAAGLSALLVGICAQRLLGGSTGDTLGATVVLAEAATCLALLGFWR